MRVLFGSIGAGVSLVAAAALSLLVVTTLLAFGGWSNPLSGSLSAPSIVFDSPGLSDADLKGKVLRRVASRSVVVTAAPQPRAARASAAIRRASSDDVLVRQPPLAADTPAPVTTASGLTPPAPPARPATPVVAKVVKPTVDVVRALGNDLSATVESTGTALSAIAAPLGPPVSAAVQGVLNLIAALLKSTTNSVGATVDRALQ